MRSTLQLNSSFGQLFWLYFSCSFLYDTADCSPQCDAYVSRPPWPMQYVFIPPNSTLEVDCATNSTDVEARFIIDIPGAGNNLQFIEGTIQNSFLERHGLFEDDLSQSMKTLFTNNTVGNNQTVIKCNFITIRAEQSHQFTLFTYEPRAVVLMYDSEVDSLSENALNISWSQGSTFSDVTMMFSLTVTSDGEIIDTIVNLTEMHYYFSIPGASSPCKVYNFSVTATPVGATYTGDGCSVPSPVLSRMLPSLPNITTLAMSLNHTLESRLGDGFQLKVGIVPANYCADYSVTGYVLEVEGPTTSSMSITPGRINTVNNLLENEMYSFHIIVSNSVGNVSTSRTIINTTDVQKVIAVWTEDDVLMVQCVFVNGSTARGCMVVLVGQSHNITVNLTREGLYATGMISVLQTTCVTEVIGYDVESDGTVGTLAIEGELSNKSSMCDEKPFRDKHVLVVAVTVPGITVVCIISPTSIVLAIFIYRRHKKKSALSVKVKEPTAHSLVNTTDAETTDVVKKEESDPLYDSPLHKQKVGVRTAGDGEDHSTGRYDTTTHARDSPENDVDVIKDTYTTAYAELMDDKHFYFTLESSRPPQGVKAPHPADDILPAPDEDAPPLPPPYNPDPESQSPPPLPVYQDINDLTPRKQ